MIKKLEKEILASLNNPLNDKQYFNFHKNRYLRFDQFLEKNFRLEKSNLKVLEIGSHYLHSSVLLSNRKFNIDAMDVSEFWNLDFVQKRAKKFNLNPIIENNLSRLETVVEYRNRYDLIVFTEILEHITFNPIAFWKVVHQILKPGGVIYISTPNAFALPYFVRNLKNLLVLKSTGISVDEIMNNVTYGHHWKEYSSKEIIKYFKFLSSDFKVNVNQYHYKKYNLKSSNLIFKFLSKMGNMTKIFSDELEIIIKLEKKTPWTTKTLNF